MLCRKNLDAFDKETRNDNIDISDVDASADLFGREMMFVYACFPFTDVFRSCLVRQSFYGEIKYRRVGRGTFFSCFFATLRKATDRL